MNETPIKRGYHKIEYKKSHKTYYPHNCSYCGALIPYHRKKVQHVNIAQDPPIKYFCCKSCRDSWASDVRKKSYPVIDDLPNKMVIFKWEK